MNVPCISYYSPRCSSHGESVSLVESESNLFTFRTTPVLLLCTVTRESLVSQKRPSVGSGKGKRTSRVMTRVSTTEPTTEPVLSSTTNDRNPQWVFS